MSKPVQFQDWPDGLDVPYGPYRAVIERVVDGVPVHVVASLGLDEYAYEMIPIKGAFAPELFSGPPQERERGKADRAFSPNCCRWGRGAGSPPNATRPPSDATSLPYSSKTGGTWQPS